KSSTREARAPQSDDRSAFSSPTTETDDQATADILRMESGHEADRIDGGGCCHTDGDHRRRGTRTIPGLRLPAAELWATQLWSALRVGSSRIAWRRRQA